METMARLMAVQPCDDVLKITFILYERWRIFNYEVIRKYNRRAASGEGECNLSSNVLRNIDRG